MPTQEKTQPAKKKRGKAAYKVEPQIQQERLRWPPGIPRTAPEDRIRGEFKLKSEGRTALDVVRESIRAYFKRVEIHKAYITYSFSSPDQAVDTDHNEPGVAIWFHWQGGQMLKLASDKFNTVIGNLRACMEVLDGFHKSTRFPFVHHDFKVELSSLQSFGLVRLNKQPLPDTKTHLDPEVDWQQVLEIDDWHLDEETGLPWDRQLPTKRYQYLSHRYHSDKKESDPDRGASFSIIEKAYKFVRECYKIQDSREEQQAEVKANAAKKAEERKAPREAKAQDEAPKPKKSTRKNKKKVEKKPAPEPEDEDQSPPPETEPTADELRSMDFDQHDEDLDDSEAVDDPNEDGYPDEEAASKEENLFDSPEDEDTEDEMRDDLEERRRRMREQKIREDEDSQTG